MYVLKIILFILSIIYFLGHCSEEDCARSYLNFLNAKLLETRQNFSVYLWNYDSNMSAENSQKFLIYQERAARESRVDGQMLNKFNWMDFKDEDIKRQIRLFLSNSEGILPTGKYYEMERIIKKMTEVVEAATVCSFEDPTKCDLSESFVFQILAESQNEAELKYYWKAWRDAIGPKVRPNYEQYIKLMNEGARMHGYKDAKDMWISEYETDNMEEQLDNCASQISVLYKQLHAYIRNNLMEFGEDVVRSKNIPVHLTSHINTQTWEFLADKYLPFKQRQNTFKSQDFGPKKYDLINLYKDLDEFLVSMNLTALPQSFWEKSIFVRPARGIPVVTTPTAYDFYTGDDYRIIHVSARLNETTFNSAFFMVGSIEYFMQYKSQIPIYMDVAVNGFKPLVGDLIKLAFSNTDNFVRLGYIPEKGNANDAINRLFFTALADIPFVTYVYTLSLWRWRVFAGEIGPHEYNCRWWAMANKYMGVEPPYDRSENEFDPATKAHIVRNQKYIGFFVGIVGSYQIYRELCIKTGQYDPTKPGSKLHECNLYGKEEAGRLLSKMLSLGKSKVWDEALGVVYKDRVLDASALLEYYQPLMDFLVESNKANNVEVGWGSPAKICK